MTSSSSSEETDEYVEGEDLNGDGDQVDDVTITTTIYTASENLGSYTSLTTEITENRSPSFFNTNKKTPTTNIIFPTKHYNSISTIPISIT